MPEMTRTIVDLNAMGQAARVAARGIANLSTARKNAALLAIADGLEANAAAILEANAADIDAARAKGTSDALLDRLLLTPARIARLAADTRAVAGLPDPVGTEFDTRVLPNGIRLTRRRVPIGVIGVIYEARPNVTIDIAVLCLKTGNATILRGGSETLRSNLALVAVIQQALAGEGLPAEAVQVIADPDRAHVRGLMRLDRYVDMLIPRGGHRLHALCREEATVPVITGGIGICHIFVDASADLTRALDIVENAKVQRPSVCNALDTLLVHSDVAGVVLPAVVNRLAPLGVAFRAEPRALAMVSHLTDAADIAPAGPDDFDTEWMSLVLGLKVVDDIDTAIDHIQAHSMEHTDSILTNDWAHAQRFVDEVTSSAVFVNASTRFNDGGQFGLGAEVAISTQKLHARGPMGLQELTTYKWIGLGDGHIRP